LVTALGLGAALVAIGVPGSVRAAPLAYSGTLTLEIPQVAPPLLTVSGAGLAIVNGSGGGAHVATLGLGAGVFQTTGLTTPVTDPAAAPIEGLRLTIANGSGSVAGSAGVLPLAGTLRFCLFLPCSAQYANISVPLAPVGVGGVATAVGAIKVTTIGAPWTTGTVSLTAFGNQTFTQMGLRHGPASLTSSTAAPSGVIQLVTPIVISTSSPNPTIPAFGTMTLHFVPEPGTLALLGAGVAILARAGRRRIARAGGAG
jgi:hypothetical protein